MWGFVFIFFVQTHTTQSYYEHPINDIRAQFPVSSVYGNNANIITNSPVFARRSLVPWNTRRTSVQKLFKGFIRDFVKRKPKPFFKRKTRQFAADPQKLSFILGSLSNSVPVKRTSISKTKFATTKNLKEIVIGRCYEYMFQRDLAPKWDCEQIWLKLFNAFAYKGPCDVTMEDYRPVLEMVAEDVPENKGLLWSGSREVSHKLSDMKYTNRFVTLEDTLAGFIVNKLSWCGSKIDSGINFEECPWECSIQSNYWALANEMFARKLRGVVHLILNGTRQHLDDKNVYPSFMHDRYYLGPYVIPELDKKNIDKVSIIVAHTLDRPELERCGEKSVQLLIDKLKAKQIPVECHNDPDAIRHLLCVDNPAATDCRLDVK